MTSIVENDQPEYAAIALFAFVLVHVLIIDVCSRHYNPEKMSRIKIRFLLAAHRSTKHVARWKPQHNHLVQHIFGLALPMSELLSFHPVGLFLFLPANVCLVLQARKEEKRL